MKSSVQFRSALGSGSEVEDDRSLFDRAEPVEGVDDVPPMPDVPALESVEEDGVDEFCERWVEPVSDGVTEESRAGIDVPVALLSCLCMEVPVLALPVPVLSVAVVPAALLPGFDVAAGSLAVPPPAFEVPPIPAGPAPGPADCA